MDIDEWQAAYNSLPFIGVLLDATDLTVIAVTDFAVLLANETRESLVGKHLFIAFPPRTSHMNSSDYQDVVQASFTKIRMTGKPDRIPVIRYDVEGSTESRYWSILHYPVFVSDELRFLGIQSENVTAIVQFGTIAKALNTVSQSLQSTVDMLLQVQSLALSNPLDQDT
jgi:hypothetical protein